MNENEDEVIHEIQTAAGSPETVAASKVRAWAKLQSVEVLGAVVAHFIRNSRRIEPPLTMEETCEIVQRYYRECMIQNPRSGNYAQNQTIAGYELVSWFNALWKDQAVPREYLARIKGMLGELLLQGTIPQDVIVNAVLEHLFEAREIREFFADWKTNPQLRAPFERALEWSGGPGGR